MSFPNIPREDRTLPSALQRRLDRLRASYGEDYKNTEGPSMQFRQNLYSAIEGEKALDASLQQLSLQPVSAVTNTGSGKMPIRYEYDSTRKWVQETDVFSKFYDGVFKSPRTRCLAAVNETLWAKCIGDNVILSRWNPGDRKSARKFVVSCQPSEEGDSLTPGLTGIVANSDRSRILVHGLRMYPSLCDPMTVQLDSGFSKNNPELGELVSASSYSNSHPALFVALTVDGTLSMIDARLSRQTSGFPTFGDQPVTAWDCDIHPTGHHVAVGLTCGAALYNNFANIVNRSWTQIHNIENSSPGIFRQIRIFDVRYMHRRASSVVSVSEVETKDTPCRVRWAPSAEKQILATLLCSGTNNSSVRVYAFSETETPSTVFETTSNLYSSISWLAATGPANSNQLWMSLSCGSDMKSDYNIKIAKFSKNFDAKLFDDDAKDRSLESLRIGIQKGSAPISSNDAKAASCIVDAAIMPSTTRPDTCILSTVHPRGVHATIQCKTVQKPSSFVL